MWVVAPIVTSVIERRTLGGRTPRSRQRLRECYPAVAESVPHARMRIAEFAASVGACQELVHKVRLAVSEALTNVVQHAYPSRPGGIHVSAWLAGGELWLLIGDVGCGLHAGPESNGLGVGLGLISQMADGFAIVERSSGGTELRMRFELG